MNFYICNPFDNLPEEGAPHQRYSLLARELSARGHNVTWFTADYSHSKKAKRTTPEGKELPTTYIREDGVQMRLIKTLPYKRNISLQRIKSHVKFSQSWLKEVKKAIADGAPKPDRIIISTPPLSTYNTAAKLRKLYGCKIILDIMDAWPEAFTQILPHPLRPLLYPLYRLSRKALDNADIITGISENYIKRSNNKAIPKKHFYHSSAATPSSELSLFSSEFGVRSSELSECETISMSVKGGQKNNSELRTPNSELNNSSELRAPNSELGAAINSKLTLLYIGNMGKLYELKTVIEAVKDLAAEGKEIALDLAGSGTEEMHLRNIAQGCDAIRFHGFIGNKELNQLLSQSDIGIIPLKAASMVAIPYKLPDYASYGLAILSSLDGECNELIKSYNAGIAYSATDKESLKKAISQLIGNTTRLNEMQNGAYKMAKENFCATTVYPEFAAFCEQEIEFEV